jgi:pyruvate formate lyase activating enzyme
LPHTDLFLYDIKHMDSDEHRRLTGVGNERILQNARRIAEAGKELIVRMPLIPGCNDSEENVSRTAQFARELPGVDQIDILPYHRFAESKYPRLGREYALTEVDSPSEEQVAACRQVLEAAGLRVRVGG